METEEVKRMLEVSHLGNFILSECAPSDDNDTIYHKKLLANLSKKLNLHDKINSENLKTTIGKLINDDYNRCIELLCIGIASLYTFIQSNWTGPEVSEDIDWLLHKRDEAAVELSLGDQCNDNSKNLEFLYLSKVIFTNENLAEICPTTLWWNLRVNIIHQLIMEEESHIILEETEPLIEKIEKLDIWNIQGFDYLETLFNVEATQFWLLYKNIPHVEKYLKRAEYCAKLNVELQGAMGKRTKYQSDEKAQLFLKIHTDKENFSFIECPHLPISVNLNDDLRLENIKFTETIQTHKLGTIEETVVLAKCVYLQTCQPRDNLAEEEIMPYLNTIIDSTKNWPLKMEALRQRCLIEMRNKRSIERALTQSESLIAQYNQLKPSVYHRTYNILASGMKPNWYFMEILADTMLSLGMVKGALDLYLKLHQWEQVIVCYTLLELRHKAAEIIRQELSKKETVKLWCLLGDAEQDTSHYERAWKLSNETSSRAQRHWGIYYFSKQNYNEAIPHLKLSAELNNIQENVWIRLGFAALQVENWKLAAKAYRHYCELEQTSFEAWNNLAKAYIKLGDKSRAWRSLQDAVKCNYEKWEVWDNFMIVSIDLGYFSDVIRSYHRILDLKGKHIDVQVLSILTNSVVNDINDGEGNGSRLLSNKLLELFGRITSNSCNDPDVWRLYAELTATQDDNIHFQKTGQFLQRSYRLAVSDTNWYKDKYKIKCIIELCCRLADAYLKCAKFGTIGEKKSMLGSGKLSLQAVLSKVKLEKFEDSDIDSGLDRIEDKLKVIVDELSKINQSV